MNAFCVFRLLTRRSARKRLARIVRVKSKNETILPVRHSERVADGRALFRVEQVRILAHSSP